MRLSEREIQELARDDSILEVALNDEQADRESHCRAHLFGSWVYGSSSGRSAAPAHSHTEWIRNCELCGKPDTTVSLERPK